MSTRMDKIRYASRLLSVNDIIHIIHEQLMKEQLEPKPLYIKVTPDGEFSVFYGEEDKGWLDG